MGPGYIGLSPQSCYLQNISIYKTCYKFYDCKYRSYFHQNLCAHINYTVHTPNTSTIELALNVNIHCKKNIRDVRQQIEKNDSCVCLLCFKNALLNYSNISVYSFLLFSKEILNVSKYFYASFVRFSLLYFESQLLEVSNWFFCTSTILLQFIKSLLKHKEHLNL